MRPSILQNIEILFAIPTPRDNIPQVIEAQNHKWKVDRILPKFLNEYYAYQEIRNYFLENEQYTHLALAADDIVVEPRHINMITEDLMQFDFPVLSGVINVYQEDLMFGNITPWENVPELEWERQFYWYRMAELRAMKEKIIPVGFAGFGLTVIRRDVVEKIDFDSDGDYNKKTTESSGSMDVVFCWRCKLHHIPIFCDWRIFMHHLRLKGHIQVGERPSELWFWPKNTPKARKMAMSNKKVDGKIVTMDGEIIDSKR